MKSGLTIGATIKFYIKITFRYNNLLTKLEHFSRRVLVQAHCILLNGSLSWRPSPPFETPHVRRQILPIGLFMLDSFSIFLCFGSLDSSSASPGSFPIPMPVFRLGL